MSLASAVLAVPLSFCSVVPSQGGTDLLSRSFARWYRCFKTGKLGKEGHNWRRRAPYLHSSFKSKLPGQASYTRFHESLDLVAALIRRGNEADGERLMKILAFPEGHWRQAPIVLAKLKYATQRYLSHETTPLALQMHILDRVCNDVRVVSGAGEPTAWRHKERDLVAWLLPVLGAMHERRFRVQLENFCRGGDPKLVLAATEGLWASQRSGSIPVIAAALPALKDADAIEWCMHALFDLHELLGKDKRRTSGLRVAKIVRALLAERKEPAVKSALLPWLSVFRERASVPVLITELERAAPLAMGDQEFAALLRELHQALEDLTGFSAPAQAPERWRRFWDEEHEAFVLAPDPRLDRKKGTTSADAFFGIPVTGKRIIFILDTSGSMSATMPARGTSAGLVTRLERAKQELLAAVYGLDRDVRFTVLLFSNGVNMWRDKLEAANMIDKLALRRFLHPIQPGGGTNLLPAIQGGLGLGVDGLGKGVSTADELFVLSDGMPNGNPEQILREVRAMNDERGARINTVYLSGPLPSLPPKLAKKMRRGLRGLEAGASRFMKSLAEQNGGVFEQVK